MHLQDGKTEKKNFSKLLKQHLAVCLASMLHPVKWPPVHGTEEDGSGLLPVSRPLISKEKTVSRTMPVNNILHHASHSQTVDVAPRLLHCSRTRRCVLRACERTRERTWGEKNEETRAFFPPPFPVVFEKLEAADDERVVFLPSFPLRAVSAAAACWN